MSENRFTLYHHPISFYSQKVFVALREKGITFKERYVNILTGEQNSEWFMKMNPDGKVPTLQDGDEIITESDNIISYLDTVCPTAPELCPDTSTPLGKDVARFSKMLNDIPVEVISYGIYSRPELYDTGPMFQPPGFDNMKKVFDKRIAIVRDKAEKHPHLREQYLAKIERLRQFYNNLSSKEKVMEALTNLDGVFDELENQLRRVHGGMKKLTSDIFLCGLQFTVADIHLAVWLVRLKMLGLLNRYAGREKHPLLYDYNERVAQRPSVKELVQTKSHALRILASLQLKAAAPYIRGLLILGLAAGLTFMLYKKYK